MQQNRGLYVAAAIFAAVAVIFVFADIRQPAKSPSTSPSPEPSPLVGIDANHLQQVVIHARGKVFTLTRDASSFKYSLCADGQGGCAAQPADLARSAQLFQDIGGLRPTHVIYGAPDGLPAYGVDKPTTAEVDVKSLTGEQVTLVVGIKTPDGVSYFVKRQDSHDVVSVAVGAIAQQLLGFNASPPGPQPTPSAGTPAASASP